jgi:hypothetical protein
VLCVHLRWKDYAALKGCQLQLLCYMRPLLRPCAVGSRSNRLQLQAGCWNTDVAPCFHVTSTGPPLVNSGWHASCENSLSFSAGPKVHLFSSGKPSFSQVLANSVGKGVASVQHQPQPQDAGRGVFHSVRMRPRLPHAIKLRRHVVLRKHPAGGNSPCVQCPHRARRQWPRAPGCHTGWSAPRPWGLRRLRQHQILASIRVSTPQCSLLRSALSSAG